MQARLPSLQPVLEPGPTRPALADYTGPGVVEACTVQYARSGEPERLTPADQPGTHSYQVSPSASWAAAVM